MGNQMVKEQTFSLMEVKGLESSEKVDLGTLLTGDDGVVSSVKWGIKRKLSNW